jgi:2-dehydropantoate 2-reductase
MTSIVVVGPGAIGGTIAAWLAQDSRVEVRVAARTAFDRLDVDTPDGRISATPQVLTDPSAGTAVDWVLVATKAYDSSNAARWFSTLCGPTTRVAVLQNGVEHVERFSPPFPADRIVPVMIDCPAERIEPGRIRQRGAVHMVVPAGASGEAFASLFSGTPLNVNRTDDFKTAVWQKLCLNSAGAVSVVLLKPAGIVNHKGVAELMRAIVRECVAVGRAEGARLDDSIVESVIERGRRSPRDSVNSMHGDRLAGRQMEIDARNGVIVRFGRKHGIATPINAMMVALLEAAQDRSYESDR